MRHYFIIIIPKVLLIHIYIYIYIVIKICHTCMQIYCLWDDFTCLDVNLSKSIKFCFKVISTFPYFVLSCLVQTRQLLTTKARDLVMIYCLRELSMRNFIAIYRIVTSDCYYIRIMNWNILRLNSGFFLKNYVHE